VEDTLSRDIVHTSPLQRESQGRATPFSLSAHIFITGVA